MSWGDLWYPYVSEKIFLKPALRLRWLTPNHVSIFALLLVFLALFGMIAGGSTWYIIAAVSIFLSCTLDCLDGRLARLTGRTSPIGDYLDKTFDVVKLGLIGFGMGYAAYQESANAAYWMLAFSASFSFMYRYYIKLETIFSMTDRDKDYLDKSRVRRGKVFDGLEARRLAKKTWRERLSWYWVRNRTAFNLDEAEHITFGALFLIMGYPQGWLWLFGIGQPLIALYRWGLRLRQLNSLNQDALLKPMRK